jgi:hypothetical protein
LDTVSADVRTSEADGDAQELEKDLSYLTIEVASPAPGLELRRGDVRLDQGAFGARLPVDPGKHVITASAPGYRASTLEVTVGSPRDAQTVKVPPLEKLPEGSATPGLSPIPAPGQTPAPNPSARPGERRPVPAAAPWVVGAVGVVGVGVGAAFGALALSSYSSAKSACPTMMGCGSHALDLRSTAGLDAHVADAMIPIGATAVAVATVLLIVNAKSVPEPKPAALTLVPTAGRQGAALSVRGAVW